MRTNVQPFSDLDTGRPVILDSITQLPENSAGRIALAASHGGLYCAKLSLEAGLRGVILHDAGIGRDQAGIAGVKLLDQFNVPAAAIGHMTARIGDGVDCKSRGRITFANRLAESCGIRPGDSARSALSMMMVSSAYPDLSHKPDFSEARCIWRDAPHGVPVELLDSNSLVTAEDAGKILVTGSHGGLLGGRPETAIKHPAFAAFYNDAGIGIDESGISRLPALDHRKIAGVTVSCESARIGDARSTLEDGIVSAVNQTARAYGVKPGQSAREAVGWLAKAWLEQPR